MSIHTKYYKAAGITFQLNSEAPITDSTFQTKFKLFEVDGPGTDNIIINHYFKPCHTPKDLKAIFSNDQWKICKTKTEWIYDFKPCLPFEPGCPVTAVANNNHTQIDIYLNKLDKNAYQNGFHDALTLFNSDQILFSKLLCDRNGLIIHANGFNINGNGILLTGKSGAGKSTLSNMLKKNHFQILCDDRMFIKKDMGIYRIYGSWCHGSVPDISKTSAPLKGIFFLKQSTKNFIDPIDNRKTASTNLIKAMVRPFLAKDDWVKTLSTVNKLVQNVDFYYSHFDLTGDICPVLEKLFNS